MEEEFETNTILTTDMPDLPAYRRGVRNKRIFLLLGLLCLAVIGLLVWEFVDIFSGFLR